MIDVLFVAMIIVIGQLDLLPTSMVILGLVAIALRIALERFEKSADDRHRRRALEALQTRRMFNRRGPYR